MALPAARRVRRSVLAILVAAAGWLALGAALGQPVGQGDPELAAEVTRLLNEALESDRPVEDLRLGLGCVRQGRFQSLEVFGSGVGIWNDEVQFEASTELLRKLLLAVRAADFAWMEGSYGGRHDPERPKLGLIGEAEAAVTLVCRLTLAIGGTEKTTSQLLGGRQHAPFNDLAQKLFELAEPAVERGVRADDLADGLRRLSAGELAPETFHLLHVRTAGSGDADGPGWMMEIEGRELRVRPYLADGGLGDLGTVRLSVQELAKVAEMLGTSAVDTLPANLFATGYSDLAVRVLAHRCEIEARRYRGLESDAQKEERRRFDGIVSALEPLARRGLAASR